MYSTRLLLAALLLCSLPAMARQAARPAPAAAAAAAAAPLTIGQLAEQARQRRAAEGSGAARGAPPPGLTIVPSTQIITAPATPAPVAAAPPRLARPAPPPEFRPALLGVYRKAGRYYVELAEQAGEAVFVQGQQTPSGWTVLAISARQVELGKPEAKGGGMRRMQLPVSDR